MNSDKFSEGIKIFFIGLAIILVLMLVSPGWAYAGNDDCRKGHAQCGHEDDNGSGGDGYAEGGDGYGGAGGEGGRAGADAQAEANSLAESEAAAAASAEAAGGSVGDINIDTSDTIPADTTHRADIKIENTPDLVTITPGSGDDCKAHIGASASIPGLGLGMNIPLPGKECRKLKYYDRMIALKQYQAAEIMFCGLNEVEIEFRALELACIETLTIYVEPEAVSGVFVTDSDYELLLMAQQQTEEFEQQQQMVEDKFAQYDSKIISDDEEIERLQREAARLRAKQKAEEERRAKTREILNKDKDDG